MAGGKIGTKLLLLDCSVLGSQNYQHHIVLFLNLRLKIGQEVDKFAF